MARSAGKTLMAPDLSQAEFLRPLTQADRRAVDRALGDLRRQGPVLLMAEDGRALLVLAAESATPHALADLAAWSGTEPQLLLTARRARALGWAAPMADAPAYGIVACKLAGRVTADGVRGLADPSLPHSRPLALPPADAVGAKTADGAAVLLVKLARLLPAALVAALPQGVDAASFAAAHDLLRVGEGAIRAYSDHRVRSLSLVAEATVPLDLAEDTRIVAFRPSDGGPEHLAIVIGDPPKDQPVLVRLHSECFTGDLLGSLRCDCGPQLRGALTEIAEAGNGILLYLAQEGRGIGLINKLKAYRLQDGGLDTVDANTALGFEADERVYIPAASMLDALGYSAVRLMTNNPDKLEQLARSGMRVVDRVPHIFPTNGHNEAYLRTKAEKSGHMF